MQDSCAVAKGRFPMPKRSAKWLHAVEALVRLELNASERFFRFSESQFFHELDKLKKQERSRPESYWRQELDFGATRGDLLSDEYTEIKEMQRLNRYFGVILIYSTLERFLFAIFRAAKESNLIKNPKTAAKRNLDFKSYVQFLKKDIGINLVKRTKEYAALNKLRAIRNAIAHHGGLVHSETLSTLKAYGFAEHQRIELEEDYFYEVKELVRKECEFVFNSYKTSCL